MLINELAKQARKDQARRQRHLGWKFKNNIYDLLGYLYWRNRYALLGKLTSRTIVLVEIYLINHYFNFLIASSFGLILFIFYYLKEFQSGLNQSTKKEIFEADQTNDLNSSRIALGKLIIGSSLYGLLCPILIYLTSIIFEASTQLQYLLLGWIVIFPMQLLASGVWTVMYAFQRHPRSFALLLGCRFLPIVSLIFFGESIGIMSYIFGLIIGRFIEYAYLMTIGAKVLFARNIFPIFSMLLVFKSFQNNLGQLFFPMIFAGYNICLALMIYLLDQGAWLGFFFLIYSLQLVIYFVLRGPQSLVMDYFLSLAKRNLIQANSWVSKGLIVRNFVLGTVLLVLLIVTIFSFDLLRYFTNFLNILPYFCLLLVARSLLQTKIIYIQNAFLERTFIQRFVVVFFILGLSQYVLLFIYRANLNLIYLIEGLSIIVFSLTIRIRDYLPISPVYQSKEQHWKGADGLTNLFNINPTEFNHSSNYLLIQIDSEFASNQKKQNVLRMLSDILNSKEKLLPITPVLYALVISSEGNADLRKRELLIQFPVIIRNILIIDLVTTINANIISAVMALGKTKQQGRKVNTLIDSLRKLVNQSELIGVIEAHFDRSSKTQPADCLLLLKKLGFSDINYLLPDKQENKQADLKHLIYLQGQLSKFDPNPYLWPNFKKPYLDIVMAGNIILSINYCGLSSKEIERLTTAILGINLILLLREFQERIC